MSCKLFAIRGLDRAKHRSGSLETGAHQSKTQGKQRLANCRKIHDGENSGESKRKGNE